MAAARAAVKLGSLVKEEAICSTKNCWTTGFPLTSWTEFLAVLLANPGWIKSRVTVGRGETMEAGLRTEAGVAARLKPNDTSTGEGCWWLCSPS